MHGGLNKNTKMQTLVSREKTQNFLKIFFPRTIRNCITIFWLTVYCNVKNFVHFTSEGNLKLRIGIYIVFYELRSTQKFIKLHSIHGTLSLKITDISLQPTLVSLILASRANSKVRRNPVLAMIHSQICPQNFNHSF